jgi:ABC-2 type transport system ATP-binding protein
MAPIVEIKNLTKRYEDFTLRDISFDIPEGGITGIFGPSGAGKTTLLRLLAHQMAPSAGSLRLFGLSYEESEMEIKNRIGYVAQEPAYYWNRSVRWTARFVSRFYENWDGALFYKLLDEFRISPYKRMRHLSRGQKTLVSLAIALSHEADLLLLDEPTAGLDMVLRRKILKRLRDMVADEGKTIVISSHITDGLDDVAEAIYFLDAGDLVLRSGTDELLESWKWIHFKNGSLAPALIEKLVEVEKQPFSSRGLTREYPAIRELLADGIASGEVKVENAKLDDILIALLQGE